MNWEKYRGTNLVNTVLGVKLGAFLHIILVQLLLINVVLALVLLDK